MKEFDNANHINNLPDYYSKSENSNNYKILQTEKLSVEGLRKDIEDVVDSLDLNAATGSTLDRYGEMINQQRGLATDDQYRFMIRSKIMQNLSNGDYASVLKALCMTFDCDPTEVAIIQSHTPCTVRVTKVPLKEISKAGLNTSQTIQLIQRLLPVGIDVEDYFFRGTFEFSATEEDMLIDGNIKGFTDTENNIQSSSSVGGFLGEIYDGADIDLPI